ncbi:MAG: hypothetical protein R3C16_11955 [Hyphomonadaceae bacterium]
MSPAGYGALRIGMTPEEASSALGHTLIADGSEDPAACETYHLEPDVAPQGMRFLARDGRIARIDDYGSEGVATPDGVAVGSTIDDVLAFYPNAMEEAGEDDARATTLTAWTTPNEAGYRFHVFEGRVTAIAAGDASILLTEGCS